MKAILVIDKPESCFVCPFRQKVSPDDIKCWAKDEIFEERFSSIQTRINCPLKPVHSLKSGGKDYIIYERQFLYGNLEREIEMMKKGKEIYESHNNN